MSPYCNRVERKQVLTRKEYKIVVKGIEQFSANGIVPTEAALLGTMGQIKFDGKDVAFKREVPSREPFFRLGAEQKETVYRRTSTKEHRKHLVWNFWPREDGR